jgi:hypothetical protein
MLTVKEKVSKSNPDHITLTNFMEIRIRDSVVGIVTGYKLDDRGVGVKESR